jgi:GST-like protein
MKLYGNMGWGSVIIEAQLAWYGMKYEFITVGDVFRDEDARKRLEAINPLAQMPTLILDTGKVLTESAAITLTLGELTGHDSIVPPRNSPDRIDFLRWLIFINTNIYPTFTYADAPERFVTLEAARDGFRETVTDHAKRLYKMLNSEVSGKWFLGDRFSAIDIYIASMVHWRPGTDWFATECPELSRICADVIKMPRFYNVWVNNFPEG